VLFIFYSIIFIFNNNKIYYYYYYYFIYIYYYLLLLLLLLFILYYYYVLLYKRFHNNKFFLTTMAKVKVYDAIYLLFCLRGWDNHMCVWLRSLNSTAWCSRSKTSPSLYYVYLVNTILLLLCLMLLLCFRSLNKYIIIRSKVWVAISILSTLCH